MSTRSVVATAVGEGWHGRYCHDDGYPTHMGQVLWQAIATHPDGPAAAIAKLDAFLMTGAGSQSISSIHDPSFLVEPVLDEWGVRGQHGARGNVRVYLNRPDDDGMDDVYDNTKDWRNEWLYIATLGGLMVLRGDDDELVGTFRYDEPEPDWNAVEYGEEAKV